MSAALKFGQARLSPPTIDQIASEAALQTPQSYFDDVVAEYVERRNIMVDGLNSIPGVFCPKPSGAFYCVAKFPVEDAEKFWNDLSHDGQLKAFYSVCKRIYEGDVVKKGSYRYVLYDVFQFDESSYGVGMECRYMELHNLIGEGLEKKSDKA
jgi:hypothetical protein